MNNLPHKGTLATSREKYKCTCIYTYHYFVLESDYIVSITHFKCLDTVEQKWQIGTLHAWHCIAQLRIKL